MTLVVRNGKVYDASLRSSFFQVLDKGSKTFLASNVVGAVRLVSSVALGILATLGSIATVGNKNCLYYVWRACEEGKRGLTELFCLSLFKKFQNVGASGNIACLFLNKEKTAAAAMDETIRAHGEMATVRAHAEMAVDAPQDGNQNQYNEMERIAAVHEALTTPKASFTMPGVLAMLGKALEMHDALRAQREMDAAAEAFFVKKSKDVCPIVFVHPEVSTAQVILDDIVYIPEQEFNGGEVR